MYHIVKKNFIIEVAPETIFESEQPQTQDAPPPTKARDLISEQEEEERTSFENAEASVGGGGGRFSRKDIVNYQNQGIKVDDDNEPVPENAEPPPVAPAFMSSNFASRHFGFLGGLVFTELEQ